MDFGDLCRRLSSLADEPRQQTTEVTSMRREGSRRFALRLAVACSLTAAFVGRWGDCRNRAAGWFTPAEVRLFTRQLTGDDAHIRGRSAPVLRALVSAGVLPENGGSDPDPRGSGPRVLSLRRAGSAICYGPPRVGDAA
ncbi:MAG: hypothetical protein AUJ96_18450 [Armatimonadetes bacterium CG2_30_66_41]|nr:MAG: hypothetical protein AUJ96_18450 [Armatimonadetes bacterium CG2_30_66_41]